MPHYSTTALGILFVCAIIAMIMNHFEDKAKQDIEMLTKIDKSKLCKLHNWNQARFIGKNQYDDCLANPDKYKETTFCTDCGYVPSFKKMVVPLYLQKVQAQLDFAAAAKRRSEIIDELKIEFQRAFFKRQQGLTTGEIIQIKRGWDLYESFLDVLPEMVAIKEFEKLNNKS